MKDHRLKVATIVGTRPELIRLSRIIPAIDKHYQHVLIHTGQNFDATLRDQFFTDLEIRTPDYQLNMDERRIGFEFIGHTLPAVADILRKERPDIALILGDTNSGLSAYVCKQLKIPLLHMEAGNRCYDDKVPEEVNRRVIDACSTWLLPYTQRSREQLLAEGYHPSRVIVTGNPITEVLHHLQARGAHDDPLEAYSVRSGEFLLATIHRSENLAEHSRLEGIVTALNHLASEQALVLSVHPKLQSMLDEFGLRLDEKIVARPAPDFSTFITLMQHAKLVLSDSGTVPEEATILGKPCVLIRDSTERPELLETNSMVLSGVATEMIVSAVRMAGQQDVGSPPLDYASTDVSSKIVKIIASASGRTD